MSKVNIENLKHLFVIYELDTNVYCYFTNFFLDFLITNRRKIKKQPAILPKIIVNGRIIPSPAEAFTGVCGR